jgi:metallo-beta-lactamase class B
MSGVHYLSSILTFASRMRRAGVDAEVSNHAFADHGLERMEQLRQAPDVSKNPFLMGASGAQYFMKVMENMLRGRIVAGQEAATGTRTAAAWATTTALTSHACCGR